MDVKTMVTYLRGRDITMCDMIADFIEQQEKYAELGRLIADRDNSMDICPVSSFHKKCKISCSDYNICKLRAELSEVTK